MEEDDQLHRLRLAYILSLLSLQPMKKFVVGLVAGLSQLFAAITYNTSHTFRFDS